MSPRLTEEQLAEMERLILHGPWLIPQERTTATGRPTLQIDPALRSGLPSLLSEVRRARLKEPYVQHKDDCHQIVWEPGQHARRSCVKWGDDCKGCTCGLSALEASE